MHPSNYLRTYTAKQLEEIAHEQIQTLKKQGLFSVPVDIELIVEKLHGMQIDVQRGLKETHHIWGMIGHHKDSDKLIILVDESLFDLDAMRRVYRMTVAEEFAHSFLLGDAIRAVKDSKDFITLQKHPDWHIHDRNAKRLAAAILMPAENVVDDARESYKQIIGIINNFDNMPVVEKYLVKQLSDKYDISPASMRFRLSEWPVRVIEKVRQAMKDGLDFLD